jgi:DNA modification methylase
VNGSALVIRGDALRLPLPDESVDVIASSPPYFALRSYRDGDEHYEGQIGSEPTPQAFLEALWAVMHEAWRVLKPGGSCFINLGDKRAGSGGHNNANLSAKSIAASTLGGGKQFSHRQIEGPKPATRRNAPDRYNQAAFGRPKSKMLLPHRFAIGCEDGMADPEGKGWVVRSDIVWQKLNGLPESVTDRVRDSHEGILHLTKGDDCFWDPEALSTLPDAHEWLFHLTKSERYFAAVDEVREPQVSAVQVTKNGDSVHRSLGRTKMPDSRDATRPTMAVMDAPNPLGKLPGSVWALPSEPLIISDEVKAHYGLPDHFAAFPTELVRRIILGWSPSGVCVECGEGRRPVVAKATITGYACPCGDPAPPTRPAVVLDLFGGTGTTAGVARALGRIGISVDLSHDYSRLARWRIERSGHFAKVVQRTHRDNQGGLFGVPA